MRLLSKYCKFVTLALTVCLIALPLSAQSIKFEPSNLAAAADAPMLMGILNAAAAQEVYVNGNRSKNGMTILPNSDVETRGAPISITLNNLGTVRVCPQTKLNLNFNGERVEIKLASGNVRLELKPNISGEIINRRGEAVKTDASGIAASNNCKNDADCQCETAVVSVIPTSAFSGFFPALSLFGGTVAAAFIGSGTNTDNTPRSISNIVP